MSVSNIGSGEGLRHRGVSQNSCAPSNPCAENNKIIPQDQAGSGSTTRGFGSGINPEKTSPQPEDRTTSLMDAMASIANGFFSGCHFPSARRETSGS